MISDKNRGETRPNIQKESIPSASERRDEAGHVGVKTPLLGSSASTMVTADFMGRVSHSQSAAYATNSTQNVLSSSFLLPPTRGEKPLPIPVVDMDKLDLDKKPELGVSQPVSKLASTSLSFTPPLSFSSSSSFIGQRKESSPPIQKRKKKKEKKMKLEEESPTTEYIDRVWRFLQTHKDLPLHISKKMLSAQSASLLSSNSVSSPTSLFSATAPLLPISHAASIHSGLYVLFVVLSALHCLCFIFTHRTELKALTLFFPPCLDVFFPAFECPFVLVSLTHNMQNICFCLFSLFLVGLFAVLVIVMTKSHAGMEQIALPSLVEFPKTPPTASEADTVPVWVRPPLVPEPARLSQASSPDLSSWEDRPKVCRPFGLIPSLSEPLNVCSDVVSVTPFTLPSPSIPEIAKHGPAGHDITKTDLSVPPDSDNLFVSDHKVASPLVSLTPLCTPVPVLSSPSTMSTVPVTYNIAMLTLHASDNDEEDPDLPESRIQGVPEPKMVAVPSSSLSLPLLSVIPPQTEIRPVVQDGTQATPNVPVTHFRPPHPEATVRPTLRTIAEMPMPDQPALLAVPRTTSRRQSISFRPSSSNDAARSIDPDYPFLNSSFTARDRAQRDEEEEQEAFASGTTVPRRMNENSQIIISADPESAVQYSTEKMRERLNSHFARLPETTPYTGSKFSIWLRSVVLVMKNFHTVPAVQFIEALTMTIPGTLGDALQQCGLGVCGTFATLVFNALPRFSELHAQLMRVTMTQGSLIEFKSFMNDFWNTYRYSEAAVHSSRVGIGRLYDKEKEMDAYQLSHPEYDTLTQPIGDFIPEIQSLLNYSPSAEIQTEFLERIRCALYQNNPNRFAVNLERMDMLASPAKVLQDMVTWDLKQPYAVATTQAVEAFERREHPSPSSGYQSPRRPTKESSSAYAAGATPASTYVPNFPPWIDHKYWPNSLSRDNIEHTPRYKSPFMNFLFDKNYAHQYSSELFSTQGKRLFCRCRACLDMWAKPCKSFVHLPPNGGPIREAPVPVSRSSQGSYPPSSDQSSRGHGSYRGYPRGNRGRGRGNNSSRGRDRYQNGRGRGPPGSSAQNVAETDEFSQDCRYDPSVQQQYEREQYGEQYEPEVQAPYMVPPSAPPAQFVAPSPAQPVRPKSSQ